MSAQWTDKAHKKLTHRASALLPTKLHLVLDFPCASSGFYV